MGKGRADSGRELGAGEAGQGLGTILVVEMWLQHYHWHVWYRSSASGLNAVLFSGQHLAVDTSHGQGGGIFDNVPYR